MTKLHEILAVDADLDSAARTILDERVNTFTKKVDHFLSSVRKLTMIDESREKENLTEIKEMVTTVDKQLKYMRGHVVRFYDNVAKKEATNQTAKADLVVGGKTLAKDLPATLLLGLETRLKYLRNVYLSIPTLQPGIVWEKDPSEDNVYLAKHDDVRLRTEKQPKSQIIAPATEQHPAQTQTWTADVAIGTITISHKSGMLTPAEKSVLIGRIDELMRGVKQARQRANKAEVVKLKIGDVLFDYIHAVQS